MRKLAGRIVTHKYRVEVMRSNIQMTHSAWRTEWYGKPNVKNLMKWVDSHNASFTPSGVNYHISKGYGFIAMIYEARIVRQSDDTEIARYRVPAFQAI